MDVRRSADLELLRTSGEASKAMELVSQGRKEEAVEAQAEEASANFGLQCGPGGGGNSDWFVNNTCVANSDTGGFRSDCDKAHGGDAWPLMEVSGNTIYTKAGSWTAKVCDKTNVLAGKWPDPAAVVEMGRKVLGFPSAAAAPVEASA